MTNNPLDEMIMLAFSSLRQVLDNSADAHDFQGRADRYLEAVRDAVSNAHRLYALQTTQVDG
jgi:hypothetical protein